MKISFLLYPTHNVQVNEDTSFWLMRALRLRGHDVSHFESRHLHCENGRVYVRLTRSVLDPLRGFRSNRTGPTVPLTSIDAVIVRKEPPFDADYLHTLQMLSLASEQGLRVVNDAGALLRHNEKTLLDLFPEHSPRMCWAREVSTALGWIRRRPSGSVVLKPLDNRSGSGVLRVSRSDKTLPSLLQTVTEQGKRWVVLQEHLQAAAKGDKRILLCGDRIAGVFRRTPPRGDFRSNLSVGGRMSRCSLTSTERRLVDRVAPELVRRGLWLSGLDVIDGKLVEINITSPSGLPEIAQLYGKDRSMWMAAELEAYLGDRRRR